MQANAPSRSLHRFPAGAGATGAALGLLALAGWWLHLLPLVRPRPGFGFVQPNTALGILLCGAALVLVQAGRLRLGALLGAAATVLGALTLLEYFFGLDLGIDRLLVKPADGPGSLQPGRMAADTAVCLLLAGGVLLALSMRPRRGLRLFFVSLFSITISALGGTRLVAYLVWIESDHEWGRFGSMAVPAAAAFVLLGSGMLAAGWRQCPAERWQAESRWLPLLACTGLVIATWFVWRGLVREDRARIAAHLERGASIVKYTVWKRVGPSKRALLTLAKKWSAVGVPTREQFELEAHLYAASFTAFQAVAWADESLAIRWALPSEGNEDLVARRIADPGQQGTTGSGANRRPPRFIRLQGQPPSDPICLAYAPVVRKGRQEGALLGVIRLKAVYDSILTPDVAPGCSIAILDGMDEVWARRSPDDREPDGRSLEANAVLVDSWSCRVWPGSRLLSSLRSFLPPLVLLAGHALAVLLALATLLAQVARSRARELLEANRRLEDEIAERQRVEESLRRAQEDLEARVRARTTELSSAVAELRSEVLERKRVEGERERLVEQLEAEKERLAEADGRKDQFLAVLGHELRNPLASIVSVLEARRLRGGDPAGSTWHAEILERQVKQLTRLVDDLLDVSRIRRGMVELRRERLDIVPVLRGVIETVWPLIEAKRQELEVSLPQELLEVNADPARLGQALANLLKNAASYTGAGGRIFLGAARSGKEACVTVRDTGIGLAPETLCRLFTPFTRANPTHGSGAAGLGLGLAIAKSLVELHGGAIAARSDGPGNGSELTVRLPLFPRTPAEEGAGARAPPATSAPPARRRVFLVDDNEDAAAATAELVRLWGHDVQVAHDAESALAAIPAYGPDVVLLDLELPGMSGYQAARRLRDAGLAGLKIVALTGYGEPGQRGKAAEAGIDLFLVKPVEARRLQCLLEGE